MPVKNIKCPHPVGSQVLVEILNAQESFGTTIQLDPEVKMDTPQAYVIALGPTVPEEYGIQPGDRVFFSTAAAVLPPGPKKARQMACIDYMSIKGKLEEEQD